VATAFAADIRESWLARRPIAHRGLHDRAAGRPENSLAAFEHACALGFPAELDVRLSRDGVPVVFHDRTLRRVTGEPGRVSERRAAELAAMPLLRTGERVPLLEEVLALVAGRVPLLVELKPSSRAAALERAALAALDGYPGEIALQSFKGRTLHELHRYESPHALGHLWKRRARRAAVEPAFLGCQVEGLPNRAVQRRRDAGAIVLAWTVTSPAEAERALRHVDNYIFEAFVPDRLEHGVTRPAAAPGAGP
jgi:glycerophosphoryl diester phosphodiesterase